MRNGFAANHGCQFLSLSYSLIDGLKGVQIVSLRRLHAVKNQGCARELGLLQNGTPCCGNQFFKVGLVSRHEMATEIEGQPSKQAWCLQKGKCVPSVHQQDCYNGLAYLLLEFICQPAALLEAFLSEGHQQSHEHHTLSHRALLGLVS